MQSIVFRAQYFLVQNIKAWLLCNCPGCHESLPDVSYTTFQNTIALIAFAIQHYMHNILLLQKNNFSCMAADKTKFHFLVNLQRKKSLLFFIAFSVLHLPLNIYCYFSTTLCNLILNFIKYSLEFQKVSS